MLIKDNKIRSRLGAIHAEFKQMFGKELDLSELREFLMDAHPEKIWLAAKVADFQDEELRSLIGMLPEPAPSDRDWETSA